MIANALRRAANALEFKSLSPADAKNVRIFNRVMGNLLGDTATGHAVTIDRALQLSTFWSCVRLISETIAGMPIHVYRRKRDDSRVIADDIPLYNLLRISPNAEQTPIELIEGIVFALAIGGNAYVYKNTNGIGDIASLELLRFTTMEVRRNLDTNELEYWYFDQGKRELLDTDKVWHVKGFGNGGMVGLSTLAFARQTMGLSIAAEETAASAYRNGTRPGGVLQMKDVLKGPQRKEIQEAIIDPFVGTLNAGGVMLLEGGMEWKDIQSTLADFQMLETRGFNVEEICRWLNVPPVLIGHQSGQSMWGSGIEQVNIFFLTYCLLPYIKRIQSSGQRALIPREQWSELYIEMNTDALFAADSKGRAELYSKYTQNGIYTRNEVRAKENMPRSDQDGMDKFTVQSALLPIDKLGIVSKMPTEEPVAPGAALLNNGESKQEGKGA